MTSRSKRKPNKRELGVIIRYPDFVQEAIIRRFGKHQWIVVYRGVSYRTNPIQMSKGKNDPIRNPQICYRSQHQRELTRERVRRYRARMKGVSKATVTRMLGRKGS